MNLEDYIKDLDPELQEKARACGSAEELLALAKEAKVPLPDEALAAIAGGDDQEVGGCGDPVCPKCGSSNLDLMGKERDSNHPLFWIYHYVCKDCGHIFNYENGGTIG